VGPALTLALGRQQLGRRPGHLAGLVSLGRPRDVLQDRGPSIVSDYKRLWPVAFTRVIVCRACGN
jgi:hypothetical protein